MINCMDTPYQRIAGHIRRSGWHQCVGDGRWRPVRGMCLLEAIWAEGSDNKFLPYLEIVAGVHHAIFGDSPGTLHHDRAKDISRWNDDPERVEQDLYDVLQRADEEHNGVR